MKLARWKTINRGKAVIWLSLLHYYTTFSGFVAYFFILGKKVTVSKVDFLILCGLLLLFAFQLLVKELSAVIIDFRFYWGWMIFYFIFKGNVVGRKTFVDALVALSILTLLETVLINTVLAPYQLPNFPSFEAGMSEWKPEGYFQRPYSFGASATVGSSLLVALMALCNVQGWRLWLSILAVLIFVSGTGTIALLVLLLVRYRPLLVRGMIPLGVFLFLAAFFLPEKMRSIADAFTNKVGLDYIDVLIDLKLSAIREVYENIGTYRLVFGDPEGFRGGDFGALAFALSNGFLGLLLLLSMVFARMNKANMFPLLLVIATTFHYPVMFFLPGQMMFGLLLSVDRNVNRVALPPSG